MLIDADASRFASELVRPGNVVLLSCFRDTALESGDEAEVRQAAELLGDRAVCLRPVEQDWDMFRTMCSIGGTPTFVVFKDGREVARKRGRTVAKELVEFVVAALGNRP